MRWESLPGPSANLGNRPALPDPEWSVTWQRWLHVVWSVEHQRYFWEHYVEGQGWVYFQWCPVEDQPQPTAQQGRSESLPPWSYSVLGQRPSLSAISAEALPNLERHNGNIGHSPRVLYDTRPSSMLSTNTVASTSHPEPRFFQNPGRTMSAGSLPTHARPLPPSAGPLPAHAGPNRPNTPLIQSYPQHTTSIIPSPMNPGLSEARAAWAACFESRKLRFGPKQQLPFQQGKFLGRGGNGEVHSTSIQGIAMAWKRYSTNRRRLTTGELNEANILQTLSNHYHRHVVELIGSYIHRKGTNGIEIGLFIWPVAHCNLESFLDYVDELGDYIHDLLSGTPVSIPEDIESVLESLHTLLMPPSLSHNMLKDADYLLSVHGRAKQYLHSKIGCIGEAVAYLHQQGIRHKDLKPAQILLSPHGLWLTDFGWSRDTSQLINSVTNGGDTTSLKYQSPERAASQPCGKPEDVFTLGCIYLEMSYRLASDPVQGGSSFPWAERRFYSSLNHIDAWIAPLSMNPMMTIRNLAALIKRMVLRDPRHRPLIHVVLTELHFASVDGTQSSFQPSFFSPCCT